MKSPNPNLKELPPIDNNKQPERGPSNPPMQGRQPGVRVPMFRFELSCMPPGHPSPLPIDAEELNDYDIVYYYTSYDNAFLSSLRPSDHEPEGGPTCPLAQGGQPVAPVEPSLQAQLTEADNDDDCLQPQGSTPHEPIVVILLDSDDDEDNAGVNDDDDVDNHNDDDNEEGLDVAGDDNVIISSPTDVGQATSSRRAQEIIDTESVEIVDNHQHNIRRVDSQPPVNIHDFNVQLIGTRSSMAICSRTQGNPFIDVEPAETSSRNQRRRLDVDLQPSYMNFEGTSSSMVCVEPVTPLPSPPPRSPSPPPPPPPTVPTYTCPICLGPMVEETTSVTFFVTAASEVPFQLKQSVLCVVAVSTTGGFSGFSFLLPSNNLQMALAH